MDNQKGCSLIEVLISLTFVMTLGFFLMEEQLQVKALSASLVLRARASQYLDYINELLAMNALEHVSIPSPYHFRLIRSKDKDLLHLGWFSDTHDMERTRYLLNK